MEKSVHVTRQERPREAGLFGIAKEPGNSPQALRACSACAGDYEDPEQTAPMAREKLLEGHETVSMVEDKDDDGAEPVKVPADEA